MKPCNILLAFSLLTGYTSVYTQSAKAQILSEEKQPKKIRKMSISDVYTQVGAFVQKDPLCTMDDFKALAPKSDLLKNDFTGYTTNNHYIFSGKGIFAMMVGIKFSDKEKTAYRKNPQLRLGINYFSATSISKDFHKSETKHYDTIPYDTIQGQPTYLYKDSVISSNYSMNYSSEQLRLDASLIYRTDQRARWSFFAGIGITAGMSINAYTDIYYSDYSHLSSSYSSSSYTSSYPYSYSDRVYKSERHRNKNNFGFSAFIPMGIDFRIGRKKEPWRHTHLFYELRPGINSISIPEVGTITSANMQFRFGIRVSVD